MSKDYLSYQVNQVITEQLKGILTAKDLANMVITLKIEFKNKKETEEEKEAREREEAYHERKSKYADFILKWGLAVKQRLTCTIKEGKLLTKKQIAKKL